MRLDKKCSRRRVNNVTERNLTAKEQIQYTLAATGSLIGCAIVFVFVPVAAQAFGNFALHMQDFSEQRAWHLEFMTAVIGRVVAGVTMAWIAASFKKEQWIQLRNILQNRTTELTNPPKIDFFLAVQKPMILT